jgi:hypothetical protein
MVIVSRLIAFFYTVQQIIYIAVRDLKQNNHTEASDILPFKCSLSLAILSHMTSYQTAD